MRWGSWALQVANSQSNDYLQVLSSRGQCGTGVVEWEPQTLQNWHTSVTGVPAGAQTFDVVCVFLFSFVLF